MSWQFNGINSVIYMPSGSWSVFHKEGWSVSFWYKILGTGTNAHQHWFFHRSGASLTDASTISVRINETNNTITSLYRSDSNAFITQTHSPGTLNEWTSSGWVHLVITKGRPMPGGTASDTTDDVSYGALYINGGLQEIDSDPNFDDLNIGTMVFGKIGNAAANRTLSGSLAEWVKFDRVITSEEVTRLYNGNSPLNMNPAIYYPMRNDYVDRTLGLTGVGVSNVPIMIDHPGVGYKNFYPSAESTIRVGEVYNRVGKLEERGYLDLVNWAPGQVLSTGVAQTGLMFTQAKIGDAYYVAPNGPLSGCVPSVYVDTSGVLTISLKNHGAANVTVGATQWFVYRM